MSNMGIKEEVLEEVKDLDKRMEEERKKKDGSRLGFVDLVAEKFMSRKLMVMAAATTLLVLGFVTSEQWTSIALGYVGIEGFADMVVRYKNSR